MSSPARFRTMRRHLGPAWLTTTGESGLVGYSLDMMKDAFVERLYLGLLARFPESAPEDALAAIGRDRRVVRGITETPEAYAQRLIKWLDERKSAGSAFALMQKLSEYCGPLPSFSTVDAQGNWYSRAVGGAETYLFSQFNWEWDDHPTNNLGISRWSRFWVIIYPRGLWTEGDYWAAGEAWGARPGTWGSTATADQIATVRFLIDDWKPAGTKCGNIILAFDNASFDPAFGVSHAGMPNFGWEHWSHVVGGVQVPARLDTARYMDGV